MKRIMFIIGLLISAATGWGQTYSETPADTVYLKNGKVATVHIKRIEEAPEGKGFGYQVFTYESLDLLGKDYWAQGTGGYSWVSEKYREGWWGVEIQKIVFADGYELWFTNGDINRDLLLQAPKFSGSHGNILAEGVVTLNPQETRKLIGEETYNLGYKVKKRQAKLGLARTLVSAPVVLLCVWKKDNKEDKTAIGNYTSGEFGYMGATGIKYEKMHCGTL